MSRFDINQIRRLAACDFYASQKFLAAQGCGLSGIGCPNKLKS